MTQKIPLREIASRVGEDLGASSWIEITQDLINDFARVTRDHQWMHVDVERAKREMGSTIAHGLLIASLLPVMSEELAAVSDYEGGYSFGFDKLRYTNTVKPGQRVRLRQSIKSVSPHNQGQRVVLRCTVEIDGVEKPALVADWVSFYYGPR